MFRYYIKLAWKSMRRNPIMTGLMVAAIAVVSLLAPFDGDAVVPVPDGVSARLADLLSQRNLTADPVDVAAAAAALSRGQTTPQRLSWAVEQALQDTLIAL